MINLDVLCLGHACYDLVFAVERHPAEDEKMVASAFKCCGGGPAANAAVTAAVLGYKAGFAGYLGRDIFGQKHLEEFESYGVSTGLIVRGSSPTPLSTVWVKPDGKRSLVNYRGETNPLPKNRIDFKRYNPGAILFDGHQPDLSVPLAEWAIQKNIPTVLDAGSVHRGTRQLVSRVDYLVASEKFARDFTATADEDSALTILSQKAPCVVITLGPRGLIWKNHNGQGAIPAFPINAVDTTGAGDAFHGAFTAAIASGKSWLEVLHYAGAVGALCCTAQGARLGIPSRTQVENFLKRQ